MNNSKQKGFAPIAILGLVAILIVGGMFFLSKDDRGNAPQIPTDSKSQAVAPDQSRHDATPTPSTSAAIVTSAIDLTSQERHPLPTVSEPRIKLISPNGGEIWQIGNRYQFRWEASNATSLTINLDSDETGSRYGVDALVDPASGVATWTVRNVNLPPGRYRVSMTATNGNLVSYAYSSNYFTIVRATAKPDINLLSPKNEDTWTLGTPQNIDYSYAGPQATFNFALYRNGSLNRCLLGTSSQERGSFTFNLNSHIDCGNGQFVTPGKYKVEIIALPESSYGESATVTSRSFNIVNP